MARKHYAFFFGLELLLTLVFFFGMSPASAATVGTSLPSITSGLVGWWTFDGKDLIQNATDRSGQGNTGSLSGFVSTTTVQGKIGQALRFNGSTGNVSAGTTFGNFAQTDPFTLSAWINPALLDGANHSILFRGRASGNGGIIGYELRITTANKIRFILANDLNNTNDFADSSALPKTNTWYHVVGVWNPALGTGKATVFINGSINSTETVTGSVSGIAGSGTFLIGKEDIVNVNFFQGLIDDVRIYNRALSSQEVKLLYNQNQANTVAASVPSITSGLVGYWTFDGKNMVQNVSNSVSGGLNGNLTNFTATTTAPGKIGQALSFNGVNNFVTVGNLGTFTTATYSFWINSDKTTNHWPISTLGGSLQGIVINTTTFRFRGYGQDITKAATLSPGWKMCTVTADGSFITFYVNGVQLGTQTAYSGSNSLSSVLFGQRGDGLEFTKGLLDDVRIYNRALSSQEVQLLYNKAQPVTAAASPASITSGLVGNWTFDGKNMIRNVTDSSGSNNSGRLNNYTSTTTTVGKVGQALTFNGTNQTATAGVVFSKPYTIMVWVKSDTQNQLGGIFAMRDQGGNGCAGNSAHILANGSGVYTFGADLDPGSCTVTIGPEVKGKWTHLAVTVDSTGATRTFFNGTPTANTGVFSSQSGTEFKLGNDLTSTRFFKGSMDDFRVYNRALTPQEVNLLYNAQK